MFDWLPTFFRSTKKEVVEIEKSEAEKLLSAATDGDHLALIDVLNSDVCVNAANSQSSSALHLAVRNDRSTCVEVLLRHPNVSLRSLDRWGRSAIHLAVVWQRLHILRRLLEHEPDLVNMVDEDGKTALHYASANAASDFIKLLLQFKADLNIQDRRKWTPLMCAVAIQCVDTVKLLLENGALCYLNSKHSSGTSALHIAIEKHNVTIVTLLLDYGAPVEYKITLSHGMFPESEKQRRSSTVGYSMAPHALEHLLPSRSVESIMIAQRIIQGSSAPPDGDSILKIYTQYMKPTTKGRTGISFPENIPPKDVLSGDALDQLSRLIELSFAAGADMNSNILERLKRLRITEDLDELIYSLIHKYRIKTLQLQTILAIRRHLLACGHANLVTALRRANLPYVLKDLVLLGESYL